MPQVYWVSQAMRDHWAFRASAVYRDLKELPENLVPKDRVDRKDHLDQSAHLALWDNKVHMKQSVFLLPTD